MISSESKVITPAGWTELRDAAKGTEVFGAKFQYEDNKPNLFPTQVTQAETFYYYQSITIHYETKTEEHYSCEVAPDMPIYLKNNGITPIRASKLNLSDEFFFYSVGQSLFIPVTILSLNYNRNINKKMCLFSTEEGNFFVNGILVGKY